MGRSRGLLAGVLCGASLAFAPAAQAAQGTDSITRGVHLWYDADPGEANTFSAEIMNNGWLHLKDKGAIIRWTSVPAGVVLGFGLGDCFGGVWDVFCTQGHAYMHVDLGDREDTFVNSTASPAEVFARDGETDRISCGANEGFDEVYADPQDVIVDPAACDAVYLP